MRQRLYEGCSYPLELFMYAMYKCIFHPFLPQRVYKRIQSDQFRVRHATSTFTISLRINK